MDFVKLNRHKFSPTILARGQDYEEMGNVSITTFSATHVNAIVDGSEPYEVHMDFNKDGHIMRHHCTCPYQAQNKLCKHLAAVLYAMDNIPDSQFIKAYPLEDETTFSPFASANNWSKDEFPKNATVILNEHINDDKAHYEKLLEFFFKSSHAVYGYGGYKQHADALVRVYADIKEQPNKDLFLPMLASMVTSNAILSIFFAKSLYRIDTKVRTAAYLKSNPDLIVKFNTEFANAINPFNIFSFLDEELLENIAKTYYFSVEFDMELFIEACEEQGLTNPLRTLMKLNRVRAGRYANRILNIIQTNSNEDVLLTRIHALEDRSINFDEFLSAYVQADMEKRKEYEVRICQEIDFNPCFVECIHLACGEHLTIRDINHIEPRYFLLLLPIVKELDVSYLEKVMPKYIEKASRPRYNRSLTDGEFIEIVKIIDAFAFIPAVAMILLEENMVNQSYYNASTRYEYLSLANRIGLLGQLSLKSFDEV